MNAQGISQRIPQRILDGIPLRILAVLIWLSLSLKSIIITQSRQRFLMVLDVSVCVNVCDLIDHLFAIVFFFFALENRWESMRMWSEMAREWRPNHRLKINRRVSINNCYLLGAVCLFLVRGRERGREGAEGAEGGGVAVRDRRNRTVAVGDQLIDHRDDVQLIRKSLVGYGRLRKAVEGSGRLRKAPEGSGRLRKGPEEHDKRAARERPKRKLLPQRLDAPLKSKIENKKRGKIIIIIIKEQKNKEEE